ncbi:hypothetical protein [Arenibaculum sp.]|jgi:hypothetical protein|uniref:hypothetical protein n=1 Tax=Arenibaculum sp. TaxID=2865862 RepID=UPI002E124C21|nr:hypothetical protein [Arenibaculum sp.]
MKYLSGRLAERSTAAGIGTAVTAAVQWAAGGADASTALPMIVAGLLAMFAPTTRTAG